MGGCISLRQLFDLSVRPAIVAGRYHRLPRRIEDDFTVERTVLGTGFNGSVFRALGRKTPGVFAVKGFHLHGLSPERVQDLRTEAEIFLSMDHPHVARLVGVYESFRHLYLVMECLEGGELFDRVRKRRVFSEGDAATAVGQMLRAVSYIHSRGVVHRDLKLENFMYESPGSDHLKLIDFGFSKVWKPNTRMAHCVGTLSYMAPEVLNRSYTSQCDVWSLGVIAYVLLLGKMPFSGPEHEQKWKIRCGRFREAPGMWDSVSPAARGFVQGLLVVEPRSRPTAQQALEHEWITSRSGRQAVPEHVGESVAEALCSFAQASQFRRACMLVMAWSLTNKERAQVRDVFLEFDQDRMGTIKLWELKQGLLQRFDVADEQIRPIFDALDATQDGEIYYTEFLAAMVSTHIAMHDDLLSRTFQRFDARGSGYITVHDLRRVLGDSFSGAHADELLKEVDVNSDGKVSYEDFISYLKDGGADPALAEAAEAVIDAELAARSPGSGNSGEVLEDFVPAGFLGLQVRSRPCGEAAAGEPPPPPARAGAVGR